MNEALEHLDDQPQLWPRWRRGYRFGQQGLVPSKDKHLFLFVREGEGSLFGVIHPACHYVDGAERIAYDNERRLQTQDDDPLCGYCFEVELQHGVSMLSE